MNEPENQPPERFEPRAFEELFEQHRPLVRSVCQRYLRDPEDVEDAVQETFLKFLTQSRELHGSIRGWLASVAHTTSIDCIRRAGGERKRRANVVAREPAGIETHAVHEAIRRRLDAALLEIDPAARDLIVARFFHKVELRLLAGQRNTSVPTMSRRVSHALHQLGQVLGEMGVVGADELTLAEHFGDPANLAELDDDSCRGLRFAPDWQALASTPPAPTPPLIMPPPSSAQWPSAQPPSLVARPLRVGVFVSYATAIQVGVDGKPGGVHQQVRSSLFMPAPQVQLVGIIEPGTGGRGLIEATLRDYRLIAGLIGATDVDGLRSLDVILLGLNYRMTRPIAHALHRAVHSGVGLLNEYWTGQLDDTCDDPVRRELLLSATPVYSYHTPGKCGLKRPATVLRDHPLLPFPQGSRLMVRGCGPAYRPLPDAQLIIAQNYAVPPEQHGMRDLGTLPLPGVIAGRLGRGRVVVSHVWPFATRINQVKISQDAFLMTWVTWLAQR